MPNPLTDELTPQAKAELAAIFVDMRRRFEETWGFAAVKRSWERARW